MTQAAIQDHGLISDGRGAALVAVDGTIDWACLPRFDHGSCFAALLDEQRGGRCALAPAGASRAGAQAYEARTLVLTTVHTTDDGEVAVHDFLVRTSDIPDGPVRLVRVAEGRRGTVDLELVLAPRFDYGQLTPWIRRFDKATYVATGGDDGLVAWTDGEWLDGHGPVMRARLRVGEGERRRVVLTALRPEVVDRDRPQAPSADTVDGWLADTIAWWRGWAEKLDDDLDDAQVRSALTLKALVYEPTGALVAAPTTALPEAADGHRTWDYRFVWLRDGTFAGRSLAEAGVAHEADEFRRFISRTAAGDVGQLRIMYGIGGERLLTERALEGLEGWRGAGPVRVGNGAHDQFQLDVYGDVLVQAYDAHRRRDDRPSDDVWRFLAALADVTADRWREPDKGLWEWRGDARHFTYSKTMAWAALDRAVRIADETGRRAPERWRTERDAVRDAVLRHGYDGRLGAFRATLEGDGLDAAVLRLPVVGLLGADDERMTSTARVLAERLGDLGLLRRYDLDDELPGREGCFLACTFWLAQCHAMAGRPDAARAAYERAAATANHLGLFAEEYDPAVGRALGNFPQGLSHLSHLEAGVSLRAAGA